MNERLRYNWQEFFKGDWLTFANVASNPETKIIWDIDGVLGNSPRAVFSDVYRKHRLHAHPSQINRWDYLTFLAKQKNMPKEKVQMIEDGWYTSDVLERSPKNLYMKQIIDLTTGFYGIDRNYVLTSRKPHLADGTYRWMSLEYPQIPKENILIRDNVEEIETEFKARHIKRLSQQAPFVIFIDDSTKYVQFVLDQSIDNCYVINTPLGIIDFLTNDPHAFVVKRYPHNLQAMLPLLDAFRSVIHK
jgi:hypothetical protein